jgi:hypothetical protein
MKWKRESKYNVVSECGQYRICWAKSATPEQKAMGEWVFQAWHKGMILHTGTKDECKEACK